VSIWRLGLALQSGIRGLGLAAAGKTGRPEKWLLPTRKFPCFICRTQNMNAQQVSPADFGPAKSAADF
jgi:hypothetical protein